MNTKSLLLTLTLAGGSLAMAQGAVSDAVKAGAKSLAAKENYSWTSTTEVPEGTRWRPGPTHGKTTQDGLTYVEMTFGENTMMMVIHGEKGAITNRDGDWETAEELENSEGGGRFRASWLRNFTAPAKQAVELVEDAKDLTESEGVISGKLSEQGAKDLMSFRRRGGGGGPDIFDAKGSVKFWVKDGLLVKYQYKVEGVMDWNGNDIDIDRTVTVAIKDVGTTKVEVPEGAKRKLSLAMNAPNPVRGLTVLR